MGRRQFDADLGAADDRPWRGRPYRQHRLAGRFVANSGAGIYSASKFAVHGISMAMRDALKDKGIGVSVLCPANIRSNIAESVKTRPAHLSNSGYQVDEREIAALHEIYAQGMDPEELAGHVKAAIEREPILHHSLSRGAADARGGLPAGARRAAAGRQRPGRPGESAARRWRKYIEARQKMDAERYGDSTR